MQPAGRPAGAGRYQIRPFDDAARANLSTQGGLSSFIQLDATQSSNLPKQRSVSISVYLLVGMLGTWFLGAFVFLFFDFGAKKKDEK